MEKEIFLIVKEFKKRVNALNTTDEHRDMLYKAMKDIDDFIGKVASDNFLKK